MIARRFSALLGLLLLAPCLGCLGAGAAKEESSEATYDRSHSPGDLILRVSYEGGFGKGPRSVLELYGNGDLHVKRYSHNYLELRAEHAESLSPEEVDDILDLVVDSGLIDWTGEKLREPPARGQVPNVADVSTLLIQVTLEGYPADGEPLERAIRCRPRVYRRWAPVLASFPELEAAWELEGLLEDYSRGAFSE